MIYYITVEGHSFIHLLHSHFVIWQMTLKVTHERDNHTLEPQVDDQVQVQ